MGGRNIERFEQTVAARGWRPMLSVSHNFVQLKREIVIYQSEERSVMKSRIVTTVRLIVPFVLLQVVGCANQSTQPITPSEELRFTTDRTSYAPSDTIRLSLSNNSRSDITVGLRCGWYLEMFYQKRENEGWSDKSMVPIHVAAVHDCSPDRQDERDFCTLAAG